MSTEKKYEELDEEIINFFKTAESEFNMPLDLRFVFQGVSTLNKLIHITKVPEQLIGFVKADLLVQVNQIYFDSFDDLTRKILFDEELDYISFDMKSGKIKLIKPKIQIASGLGSKHGFENVLAARESEKAIKRQLEEKSEELSGK